MDSAKSFGYSYPSSANRLGLEMTLQHCFNSNFDIVPTVNMQRRQVNADEFGLSNSGFNWEGKLITNYRFNGLEGFFKDLGVQLVGEYESAEVTVQGCNILQYRLDFGLRKEFWNKKAAFTLNINDIFDSYRFGNVFDTESFYQELYWRRNVRSFRINLTYKFGNDDFKIFGRENRIRDNDD